MGLSQDLDKATELWFKAAELGSHLAHLELAESYLGGRGMEKDVKKAKYHWEIAAMAGNEQARYLLGGLETDGGDMNRALKHWMISAMGGHDPSMEAMKEGFERGFVTKNDYEKALRAYKDSINEMKSEDRVQAATVCKE
eukprot:CAMPEP_0172300276 /NCGR_PEP_ID=MMETSP1058-20130122/2397_1 /TAXON_ID=83371 /ORGANISM="Detonula confervacea, Strain CCMP 353" /LENGTH=139 /DNA_ID=CAMNT_0013010007 /DNA_START=276 /DNA_END=695 /DNA_ORIENTATION=+